jgi:methionyl-tRNA formyltransferase
VFFGTPVEGAVVLDALVAAGHAVESVVTRADKRRARHGQPAPSPVRATAEQLGLIVRTPARCGDIAHELRASGAELGVVVAYGQILPFAILEAFPLGLVNLHFSLLPRWRGAAPVERAILAGDAETGVAVMRLEAGLDTGPVLASARTPIAPDETAGGLRARLVKIGTKLLLDTLANIAAIEPEPQHGDPVYAEKLEVGEFLLDPRRPAQDLHRIVRAGNPRPGAWLNVGGRRLKVLRTKPDPDGSGTPGEIDERACLMTGDGTLELLEVQPEGRRAMSGTDWRRGLAASDVRVDRP